MAAIHNLEVIWCDTHEPDNICRLIAQAVDGRREALNSKGMADYAWFTAWGKRRQWERKKAGELLSDLDAVEEQLLREIPHADETGLLTEGIIVPFDSEQCLAVSYHKGKFTVERKFPVSYHRLTSWLWQLQQAGIDVVHTVDYKTTAMRLVAMCKADQKLEHATLHRHIRPKVEGFIANPQVRSFMGIQKAGIGEVKAKYLVDLFGSLWDVLSAPKGAIAALPGFGKRSEEKLWEAIGRQE